MRILGHVRVDSHEMSPRGKMTREINNVVFRLNDARNNIFINKTRNLKYDFMVAEFLWIWFGRKDVASISLYNRHIAQFSDDGETFKGAYGPPFLEQFPWVVKRLTDDWSSRQAVISIFRQVGDSKDVPCTLTLQFFIRDGKLHTTANMRSSDIWLGLPYDVFNFTMLANCVSAFVEVPLGSLTMNLGSCHLYQNDWPKTEIILRSGRDFEALRSPQFTTLPDPELNFVLETRRLPRKFIHWPWIEYGRLLSREEENADIPERRREILRAISKTCDMTL